MRILYNSEKISAGRPIYFHRIIFRPQLPVPVALIVWGLLPSLIFLRLKKCYPTFRSMSKRLDGSGYHLVRSRPRPRRYCVRWGHSSPSTQRGTAAPTFRPISLARIPAGPHSTRNPIDDWAMRGGRLSWHTDNCHPSSCSIINNVVLSLFAVYNPR